MLAPSLLKKWITENSLKLRTSVSVVYFSKLKELLTSAPVLHFPRFNKSFTIHIDASDCGAGVFLAQKEDNGKLAIIVYFSKRSTLSHARAPHVRHLLRGGYKRGLHAFQGGQRHHGGFGARKEKKGAGGKQPLESQSRRRRFGACFTLTMFESSFNHPSS